MTETRGIMKLTINLLKLRHHGLKAWLPKEYGKNVVTDDGFYTYLNRPGPMLEPSQFRLERPPTGQHPLGGEYPVHSYQVLGYRPPKAPLLARDFTNADAIIVPGRELTDAEIDDYLAALKGAHPYDKTQVDTHKVFTRHYPVGAKLTDVLSDDMDTLLRDTKAEPTPSRLWRLLNWDGWTWAALACRHPLRFTWAVGWLLVVSIRRAHTFDQALDALEETLKK